MTSPLYRWPEPRLSVYRAPNEAVRLSRRIVARHTDPVPALDACVHCFTPAGQERACCPLLRDAFRVLLDVYELRMERPPRRDLTAPWHPADAL